MRTPPLLPSRPAAAGLLAGLLLTGCASNLAPVRSVGEQTQKLSAAAHPMLAGAADSCMAKAMRQQLIMATRFDAQGSELAARQRCVMEEKMSPRLVALNEVLIAYGKVLVDTRRRQSAIVQGAIQGTGRCAAWTGTAGRRRAAARRQSTVGGDETGAIPEYALATRRMQKASLRELLAHQEAIDITSNALKNYTLHIHLPNLREEAREVDQLRGAVGDHVGHGTVGRQLRRHPFVPGKQAAGAAARGRHRLCAGDRRHAAKPGRTGHPPRQLRRIRNGRPRSTLLRSALPCWNARPPCPRPRAGN